MSMSKPISPREYISSTHPLSPIYNYPSPLPVTSNPNHRIYSINIAYWYYMLIQHERMHGAVHPVPLSEQLATDQGLRWTPSQARDWVSGKGVKLDPWWVRKFGQSLMAILVHLVDAYLKLKAHNGFSLAFFDTYESHNQHWPVFLCTSNNNEMIWSTGRRLNTLKKQSHLEFPGMNVYGNALNAVAGLMKHNRLSSEFSLSQLNNDAIYQPSPPDRKLVCILSDSYLRHVGEVSMGTVIRCGGGTFGDLADHLMTLEDFQFRRYDYIIINLGFNDSRKPAQVRAEGWAKFKVLLNAEAQRRSDVRGDATSILLSLPFAPAPKYRHQIKRYNEWLLSEVDGMGITVMNWDSGRSLVRSSGRPKAHYFDDDIHLTHLGFSVLWKRWAVRLEGLAYVELKMTGDAYSDSDSVKSIRKQIPSKGKRKMADTGAVDSSHQPNLPSTSQLVSVVTSGAKRRAVDPSSAATPSTSHGSSFQQSSHCPPTRHSGPVRPTDSHSTARVMLTGGNSTPLGSGQYRRYDDRRRQYRQ